MSSTRKPTRLSLRTRISLALLAVFVPLAVASAPAAAEPAPAWKLSVISMPTNLFPGATGKQGQGPRYNFRITNIGAVTANGPIVVTDTLPTGITAATAGVLVQSGGGSCLTTGHTATCTINGPIAPGGTARGYIGLTVDPFAGPTVFDEAKIESPGANPVTASTTSLVSLTPAPFGFIIGAEGLNASTNEEDGTADLTAGSHPYQLTVSLEWQTEPTGLTGNGAANMVGSGGGTRDVRSYLPPGLIVNPAATPVRCTEAQLELSKCPYASAIGIANAHFEFGLADGWTLGDLYNMVPPPGHASSFAFDALGTEFFTHIFGGLRAGSYQLEGDVNDITSLFSHSVFGAQLQFWGDPSAAVHDHVRGICASEEFNEEHVCPVEPQETPLLTMPTSCTDSMSIEASIDSWDEPGNFVSTGTSLTDGAGDATPVTECEALGEGFQPTLEARPTTNQGDSPSGLNADLHIPQTDKLSELATAHLRKAVVTLPEGLVLNPSSANGLEGCSSAQIGIDPNTGVPNGNLPACPDASRIGDLEVITPLLDHALPGSVYVATPYDNPFGSLLAIYAVVEDPQSGVLVKLAGHVEPNPNTGRLVTTFDNNPQLPFSDFKLHFFAGPGAVLRTPSVCGNYSTTSQITPWSAPESGPPATPSDDYEINGNCAKSEAAEPDTPEFGAGTVAPIAGKYTPFLIHLKREDGTQGFASVTVSPPPGLVGKLAGVPYCSEAALAAAEAKSGNAEKASPSCPAASRIGTVHVAAGAGPAPYWTTGNAYLTGPYKGAPLGMAIVVPATAGPYDLGTVVSRVALHVNPETAQITAVSDPIPHILQGIQLDVRQIEVAIDKDEFSRTGTSCDRMAVGGDLVSLLGQSTSLSVPWQLGNCTNLRFKPSLSIRLKGQSNRGGHPALRATLTMPEGSAAIAKASVALPHSEFLDQAHIGTVCTRVQYAAGAGGGSQCPPASIYGRATAWSPLLDQPLSGPVFLRSSNHELPDLVASLDGQIHVDLDGRVDSVKGGIRNTFEAVPDAPVSKFVLTMQGGKKGLLQNSTDICRGSHNATASFDAQNGAAADLSPPLVGSKCAKHRAHKRRHRRHGR